MIKPQCKICGNRHYGPCTGTLEKSAPLPDPIPAPVSAQEPKEATERKERFNRTAYQRELMRERRKAEVKVSALYAVVEHNSPEIVKIGHTTSWNWRGAKYNKSKTYAVYFIGEQVSLRTLETAWIRSIGIPPIIGRERFITSMEHARKCVELILNTLQLSYTVKYEENHSPNLRDRGTFDRNTYQREYMREYRKRQRSEI